MGTIYKIECVESGRVYIGLTKQKLINRIKLHESNYKRYNKQCKNVFKCASFDIICKGNYEYEALATVYNKYDLKDLERFFILKYKENQDKICLNVTVPIDRKNEKCKQCLVCGDYYQQNNSWNHNRTKHHKEALNKLNLCVDC